MPDAALILRVGPTYVGNLLDLGISGGSALFTVDQSGNVRISGSLLGGFNIGSSATPITNIATYAPSLTPVASAASIGFSEQTFTVTGLAVGDKVYVNGPAPAALIAMVAARVSAANTLALTFFNATAAANTPAAGTYNVVAIRS